MLNTITPKSKITGKTKKSRVRGWSKEKPGYHEKQTMLKHCGKKCFLGTKTSFPICKKHTCKVSKKGLYAALARSRQYRTKGNKYRIISRKARKMINQLKKEKQT